jgi:peroxiredoxin
MRMLLRILLLFVAVATTGAKSIDAGAPQGPRPDAVARFDAVDLDGRRWNLESMKGRITLLEFWGTWCRGCLPDHAHVRDFYTRCRERGLEVVGIVHDGVSVESLKQYVLDHDITWPQVYEGMNASHKLRELFEPQAFPSYMLIDRNGTVFASHGGPLLFDNDKMLRKLREFCGMGNESSGGLAPNTRANLSVRTVTGRDCARPAPVQPADPLRSSNQDHFSSQMGTASFLAGWVSRRELAGEPTGLQPLLD